MAMTVKEPAPIDSMYFPPLTPETVDDAGLDRLRTAIVKDAADEYMDEIKAALSTTAAGVIMHSSLVKMELETFFRSKWYKILTNNQIDGEWMIRSLQEKAKEDLENAQKDD